MDNHFDHIDRYFNGAMNQDEITEFEKQKLADKELVKDILQYEKARDLIRTSARKRMKQHLDELGQQEYANTLVETYLRYRLLRKYWHVLAASVLILAGLGYFAYRHVYSGSQPDLAQVFDAYYEVPKTDLVISRGGLAQDKLDRNWNSAILKYNEKRYEEAGRDFMFLLQDSAFSHRSAANFYLGICYLQMNLPDSARSCFEAVSPTGSLSQEASWYLGLSCLKSGKIAEADEVFANIVKMDRHYKKKEAAGILEVISEKKQK